MQFSFQQIAAVGDLRWDQGILQIQSPVDGKIAGNYLSLSRWQKICCVDIYLSYSISYCSYYKL